MLSFLLSAFDCSCRRKAQLSIEFVLMLSVSLVLLGIVFGSYSFLYKAGEYSNDVLNAKSFMSGFSSACISLSLLGNDSCFSLSAPVLNIWELSNSGKKVSLIVKSKEDREKEFFFESSLPLSDFSYELSEFTEFEVCKKDNVIVLGKK